MSKPELEARLKGRPFRLIRRFCVEQASGKKRPIDDAQDGGQSDLTSDADKLELCSAFRPTQHLKAVEQAAELDGSSIVDVDDSFETGGEDLPDAYRFVPQLPAHAEACIVVFWHHQWQALAFVVYFGLLFGLPLAVTSFNRHSKFCEAFVRRFGFVFFSMYFDAATLQDWKSAKGSAQATANHLLDIIGSPFA